MIQEKVDTLATFFAEPQINISTQRAESLSGPRPGLRLVPGEGEGQRLWAVEVGERLGRKLCFRARTIEEAVDAALTHFTRQGRSYGKPEKRR